MCLASLQNSYQAYSQGILGTQGKLMAEMSHPDFKPPPYEWPDGYNTTINREHLKAALDVVENRRKYQDLGSYARQDWYRAEMRYKSLYERASRQTTSWDLSPDAPFYRVQVEFCNAHCVLSATAQPCENCPFRFA